MTLAIFDLDNTLIGGDSDSAWGEFLCQRGYVDQKVHHQKNKQYFQDYMQGKLDIDEFLRFQLEILGQHKVEILLSWRQCYIDEFVMPLILPKAIALVDEHRKKGDHLMIITATNRFITEPIAKLFGINDLIATDPEMVDGEYTGDVLGTPSFAEGKVIRLQAWLENSDETLKDSWFYSDSRNDIPLLAQVDNPVAVDPDDRLREEAEKKNWRIISLR